MRAGQATSEPMTARQLAAHYHVSERQIRRLAAAGMPCRYLGSSRAKRFYVNEADRWLEKRRL